MPVKVFVIEEFHRDTSVLTTWNCVVRIKGQFRLAGRTALNGSGKLSRPGQKDAPNRCPRPLTAGYFHALLEPRRTGPAAWTLHLGSQAVRSDLRHTRALAGQS